MKAQDTGLKLSEPYYKPDTLYRRVKIIKNYWVPVSNPSAQILKALRISYAGPNNYRMYWIIYTDDFGHQYLRIGKDWYKNDIEKAYKAAK